MDYPNHLSHDHDPMLNEAVVADLLCQSVRTLQKWRVTGQGPAFYKFGRSVRYLKSEVFLWREERRKAHTSHWSPDHMDRRTYLPPARRAAFKQQARARGWEVGPSPTVIGGLCNTPI